MDGFWEEVSQRLREADRSWSWLARQIDLKSRQALENYKAGRRATPESIKRDIALVLRLRRDKKDSAA